MLYVLVQIIIAIILIILMGILAYGIYNKNAQEMILDMIKPTISKKETKIIDGVFEYSKLTPSFNTTDKTRGNYVDLSPSINQKGGSVYTYNFWLFIPEKTEHTGEDKTLILFNKGSNTLVKYKSDLRCDTTPGPWFLVKNPMVRLDFSSDKKIAAVIVEFNSIQSPDVFNSGANEGNKNCSDTKMIEKDKNLIGIKELEKRTDLQNKWNMITIIVSETSPDDNIFVSSNQALVKLYLNGYAYLNKDGQLENKSTAMKTNNSPLHLGIGDNNGNSAIIANTLTPSSTKIAISDLTYFNYVLEDKEIVNLFKKGCNKNTALLPTETEFNSLQDKEATLELKAVKNPIPI